MPQATIIRATIQVMDITMTRILESELGFRITIRLIPLIRTTIMIIPEVDSILI
jgi:hypothetical protein